MAHKIPTIQPGSSIVHLRGVDGIMKTTHKNVDFERIFFADADADKNKVNNIIYCTIRN